MVTQPTCGRATPRVILTKATSSTTDRKQRTMTASVDRLDEVLGMIDGGLSDLQSRELVAASEVADLLLDVRLLLMQVDGEAETPEPVTA